jgi:DNA-directed RNA polymerase subunit D
VICLKVKVLSSKGQTLKFMLEGTDPAFANSLRRIMITEIPTLAVEWVDIHDNNSALFDEIISHRIGMIPLKFNPKKFVATEDCSCKKRGCPLCQVVLVLDRKGPCTVTAGDFKSSDKTVAPLDPRIPIVELLEGQSLKLEAVARLGTGLKHAKHHAANASYHYYPEIKVTGSQADVQRALKNCPKGLVTASGKKISVNDILRSDVAVGCLREAKGIEAKGDESRIIFSVESISGLEPSYIVSRAAEILQEKTEEFRKKLTKF